MTLGVGNYLIPPLGNCLTLEGLRLGNCLIADKCKVSRPIKESDHATQDLPSRGDHRQAAPGRGAARRREEGPGGLKTLGVHEVTYYRWRKEYGGLKVSQAKRLKDLERENARLRRAVSDLTLDKLILQEASRGNF